MPEELNSIDELPEIFIQIGRAFRDLNYKQMFERFTPALEDLHQSYFDSRTGPSGEPWEAWHWRAPWAPDDHPTLEVSKALRGSLRSGGSAHVETITERSMLWGTSVAYAGIHNFGATFVTGIPLVARGGKGYLPAGTTITIPQREFLGLDEPNLEMLVGMVADEALKGVSGG